MTSTNGAGGLTVLDRSLTVLLEKPDETASRRSGISAQTERLHILHGTSLICDAAALLRLQTSTYATACTIFHRFFKQASLLEYDVWSVAQASTLLATKVEEESVGLGVVINTFCYLYRKRLLLVDPECPAKDKMPEYLCSVKGADGLSVANKEHLLAKLPLPMKLGPVYKEWHKEALNTESSILSQLGFTLHWIPDSHPHKFVLYYCQVLGLSENKFTQKAWEYCNVSCRLDLCVRFRAEVVATSSILLAALDYSLPLPQTSEKPWWEIFIGENVSIELAEATNAIRVLCITQKSWEKGLELCAVSKGFIKSCKKENGSFNDPGSFLWEQFEEQISNEHQQQ